MANPPRVRTLRRAGEDDPCERVLLVGHDCPGEIVCFEIECRECGELLREHASVERICPLIRAAVDGHLRHSRRRSRPAVAS